MSRKSRNRDKPELVREQLAAELPGAARASAYRLTGKLHDTLEAIISGCAITTQAAALPAVLDAASAALSPSDEELVDDLFDGAEPAELDDELDQDELDDDELDDDLDDDLSDEEIDAGIAELGEAFGGLALTTRILARGLLARALGRHPAQTGVSLIHAGTAAEGDSEATVVDELAQALLPANLPNPLRPSRADRREAFAEAAYLIREVGLEEFDVSCDLATSRDGTPELVAYPLPPESAHVALLEFLLDRAEGVTSNLDPLLAAERVASSWEFSRWSVAPPPGRGSSGETAFTAAVREQEYSLADRRTITLGMPVIAELAGDAGFAELFPRQHRMAAALVVSFVDVFECVALEGRRATLRSMRDGRTYDVHEHMEPIEYAPGWVAAGRLLPFGGAVHLRSPGMIFFEPEDPVFVRAAAAALGDARGVLPPALALEGFISSAVFDVRVPRTVKPARSKATARDVLASLATMLATAELERERMPDEIPEVRDLRGDESAPGEAAVQLDATIEAFMAALADQATAGGRGRDRQREARARKKRGKRRR